MARTHTLLLVRHGESTGNIGGRLVGRSDPELSPAGRAQAVALRRRVGDVGLVVTSPLARARQTAGALGTEVQVDERWVEMDYGAWEGIPFADLPRTPDMFATADFRPPNGESMAEIATRVDSALRSAVDAGVTCVVSHMGPIKWAVLLALDCGADRFRRVRVDPASVTELSFGPGGATVVRLNDRAHLESH